MVYEPFATIPFIGKIALYGRKELRKITLISPNLLPRRYPKGFQMNELNQNLPAPPSSVEQKRGSTAVIDFTVENIQGIEPPTAVDRVEYKDSKEQGLYLRVTKNGVKTFTYVGRSKGAARAERKTLGKFPIVRPAEARRLARELSGHQASGDSVSAEGRARRKEMTLSDLWTQYHAYLCATKKKPSTAEMAWKIYIGPKFASRRLSDIQYSEVERWHRELPGVVMANRQAVIDAANAKRASKAAELAARRIVRKRGPLPSPTKKLEVKPLSEQVTGKTTANRCVEIMRAMYNFAIEPKRKLYSGMNPAAQHDAYQENERSRFIQEDELGGFFNALARIPSEGVRDAILTCLLAGARKTNIISMKWEDIHLGRGEWALPGEFQKNNQPYVVPLVEELAELLERRKIAHEEYLRLNPPKTAQEKLAATFVFPSSKSSTGHIVNMAKSWAQLNRVANLKDLRLHDLRRTMGSWQAKTGASLVVIGKSLNHKDPTATAIYARLDMDPVRDSMTTASSAMFEAAGIKPTAKVIQLPSAGRAIKSA